MRENDINVNDRPKFQTKSPTEDDHCVIITRDDLTTYPMPLSLRGMTSFLGVQRPTDNEIRNNDLERFELTYQSPDWEPGADRFSTMKDRLELETAACPSTGDRSTVSAVNRVEVDVTFAISTYEHELSQGIAILAGISSMYCSDLLAQAMRGERTVSAVGSGSRTALRPETLANIPLERVKQTLAATTQRGIRIRPTTPLTRRFKMNDSMLWYEHLNTKMFTELLKRALCQGGRTIMPRPM
jgi:hypothetical protein